jgi:hypothetical protein
LGGYLGKVPSGGPTLPVQRAFTTESAARSGRARDVSRLMRPLSDCAIHTYSHDLARPRRTLQETQASSRQVNKNIKKIKQIQKNERKAFWTLAVTSQCRIMRNFGTRGGHVNHRIYSYEGKMQPVLMQTPSRGILQVQAAPHGEYQTSSPEPRATRAFVTLTRSHWQLPHTVTAADTGT